MRVIGTAGHIDHGKSSLVRHLTGINPDRLEEEQRREMTIDLGFAWIERPNSQTIGIVDVPGHRDFIENMLAGVGSIDAVLLVIAADEGVMPQTSEHLAILDLLGVQNGIVVLTKVDLVDDPDWLELVRYDIHELLEPTTLKNAEIIEFSAKDGRGTNEVLYAIDELLASLPTSRNIGQPRLSIDRVFSVSGFGTIVTGTLVGGQLEVGDEVEIVPSGKQARIRGLQSYERAVEVALSGSRVAVNLVGVEKRDILRGQLLTLPNLITPTTLVDVYFRHLAAASRPLKHNAEVKVFSRAAESNARVRLLNTEALLPGDEGWLQLRLNDPLPLSYGERYILRYPSPAETIGGGIIVETQPGKRHKRFQDSVITGLETKLHGSTADRIYFALQSHRPIGLEELQKRTSLSTHEINELLNAGIDEGSIITIGNDRYIAATTFDELHGNFIKTITKFHQDSPLKRGISREELRSRLKLDALLLETMFQNSPDIHVQDNVVSLKDHKISFTPQQQNAISKLKVEMDNQPFMPPSFTEAANIVGKDVLHTLIEIGDIVQVAPEVIFSRPVYDEMITGLLETIQTDGQIDAKTLRDKFSTSRKYAIALLEHLDALGTTKRNGDFRILGRNAPRSST